MGWAPSGGEVAFDATAGRVVAFGDGKLFRYDPTGGTWTQVGIATGPLLHRPGPTVVATHGWTVLVPPKR